MHKLSLTLSFLFIALWHAGLSCQQPMPEVIVDVNLDVLHEVGGITELDRTKFISFHSPHWAKDLLDEPEMFSYLVDKLDVGFGRDMGKINWDLNQVAEDPSRPGFPSYTHMLAQGNSARNWYAGLTDIHPLEEKSSLIVCPPVHPFWPNTTPTNPHACCGGTSYTLANVSATAELFSNWLNHYHEGNGMPLPGWFEVINEPLWQMVDNNGISSTEKIFQYHNELASGIRSRVSGVPIGGYATAIPAFEKDNFQRWDERWKSFIDICGPNMDFYSLHFYDVYNNQGQKQFRKGSHMEATFDMIEHYSTLALDTIKPFVISEFCAQTNHMRESHWSPYRDWLLMKSITPMWLSFMDRPHLVDKAVPFVVLKATWHNSDYRYQHRLMRQAHELEGQEGDHWVFTEFIKVYELWADVKGKRVDSHSTDPDIQCETWVDGNKLHVVLNNLEFGNRVVALKLHGEDGLKPDSVSVKHLWLDGDAPVLDTVIYQTLPDVLTLAPEGAMAICISYEGKDSLDLPHRSIETKYYADTYLEEIQADSAHRFHIGGVLPGSFGEGVLRLGLGRDHGAALKPLVHFNDSMLVVPDDFSGDSQAARSRFFGILEIPVPHHLIEADNKVEVSFPDEGGHISSSSLKVFSSTTPLFRSASPDTFHATFRIMTKGNGLPLPHAQVVFAGDTTYSNSVGRAVFDSIPEGSYALEVSVAGYEPYTMNQVNHGANTSLDIRMTALSHDLHFQVMERDLQTAAGNIRIEANTSIAYSDASGQASFSLANGPVSLKLTHPYFETFTDTLFLSQDSTLELDIVRLRADAKFVVTDESDARLRDAQVSLYDTLISTNTLGLANFRALPVDTTLPFLVEHADMVTHKGELTLKQDSSVRIQLLPTAIGEDSWDEGFRIFPNPAKNELYMELHLLKAEDVHIFIMDMSGRKLLEMNQDGSYGMNRWKLSLDNLKAGSYILKIETMNYNLVKRMEVI